MLFQSTLNIIWMSRHSSLTDHSAQFLYEYLLSVNEKYIALSHVRLY